MNFNFFQPACQEPVRNNVVFGLCDGQNGEKAYTDAADADNWIATVINNNQKDIVFTAVDKCVLLDNEYEGQGRCDGMLTTDGLLYLVELKNQEPPWQSEAIKQLESTIRLLMGNHDISLYKKRKAFASNKKRKAFVEIDDEDNLKFFRRTTFRIDIQAEIVII